MVKCDFGEVSNNPLYKILIASFPLATGSFFFKCIQGDTIC